MIDALGAWGQRWSVRVDQHNLDAGFLMWQLHHRLARERLPEQRVVVQFSFSGVPRKRRGPHSFWLVLERPNVELCLTDPGHEVDLCVEADLRAFAHCGWAMRRWRPPCVSARSNSPAHASWFRHFRAGCCSAASRACLGLEVLSELIRAADVLAVDENLRHRRLPEAADTPRIESSSPR